VIAPAARLKFEKRLCFEILAIDAISLKNPHYRRSERSDWRQ
jgi:hypothetical protein